MCIRDRVTGHLSNVGDVDSLAQSSIKLLSDDAKLAEFRTNALKQAQRFSLENILPEYENYYEEILRTAVHEA